MEHSDLLSWLMENAGPIVRYRVATELADPPPDSEQARLLRELLDCDEVRKWLANLQAMGPVHHSTDTAVENSVSKLVEYGLNAKLPVIRDVLDRICSRHVGQAKSIHQPSSILFPVLLSARYSNGEIERHYLSVLDRLCATEQSLGADSSCDGVDQFLMTEAEKRQQHVPKPWNARNLMSSEKTGTFPWCHSVLMFSRALSGNASEAEKRKQVLELLLSPTAQHIARTKIYQWNATNRRAYSGSPAARIHGFFGFDEEAFRPNMFML